MANITVDIKKKSIDIGSNLVAIGKGGMNPGVYDPQEIKADVFDMDNMVDGVDKHYLTTEQIEEFEAKQDALTAGDNIDITNNVISATDTTYTAGDGISIDENNVISNTRVSAEWGNIEGDIEDQEDLQEALAGKQDVISDLSEIRSNATAGKNASDTIATYGDIVTHDADEFATVEQGSKAETALQPNDNISELTNDVGYITNAYHDNTKQDVINDLETIRSGAALGTTAIQPNDNISELTNDVGYITNAYHDNTKQDTLVAGDNIQIAADGKTISATDTTYTAGQGISIDANNVISNTQTSAEWGNIQGDIEDQSDLQSALADKQDVISDLSEIRSNATAGKDASDTIATYGDIVTHDADEFATADSVGEGVLTIQKNSTTVDTFSANATENKTINITVPTQASDVGALPDTTKYAANLDLSINSSTYVVTAQLKDQDGNNIGNQRTIDLPLESVVVSGSYDSATKEVVLTLEGGSTIRFSVADLVSGLQTEITSTNKLDADLVDDSTSTNKFVTAADLTKLSNTSGVNTGDQSASDFDIKDLADTTGLRNTWSGKQDAINDLNTIRDNASAGKAASDTIATYGDVVTHDADEFATSAQGAKADTALQSGDDISELNNDAGYVTSSYHDSTKQDVLTAGDNIEITDTTVVNSDTRGPCDEGYHIPTYNEMKSLMDAIGVLGISKTNYDFLKTYLKIPNAGYREWEQGTKNEGQVRIWTATASGAYAICVIASSTYFSNQYQESRVDGMSLRGFKDTSVTPDGTWTTLFDGSGVAAGAGIFHNSTLGLISVSSNGSTWITISDKNVGATVVYNDGDILSEDNCGKLFQWGNNFGFALKGTLPNRSTTQIDVSNYGPGNYYSSDIFIKGFTSDWASPKNDNLWGGVSGGTWNTEYHIISATDTTYEAGDNISITGNEISATDMKADVQTFTSKYQMIQWDTAKKGDIAKVQATETKNITGYSSITIENGVEGGLHELTAYGYSENVSPLPSGYVQYDYVSGNATVNTGLTGGNASFTVSGNQGAVRLRDNGTLVFLGVPCKNDNNVVGFYDIISSSFKTPSSTLTTGNVVEGPTPDVPWNIMTNNGILKYNQGTSEWYVDGQQETIKISYLG